MAPHRLTRFHPDARLETQMPDADFDVLISTVYEKGVYSREGRKAIQRLVEGGDVALDAFLSQQDSPPPSALHPRDLNDTVLGVFAEFARTIPESVISRFEAGGINEFSTYWALGSATDQHSVDVLIGGLKSKDQYSRWAAAESLIRRRSKRAVPMLIELLKDRSSLVKGTIVQAMKSNKMFRRPEALPLLRRVIANKSIQTHSPGTLKMAEEVAAMISRTR